MARIDAHIVGAHPGNNATWHRREKPGSQLIQGSRVMSIFSAKQLERGNHGPQIRKWGLFGCRSENSVKMGSDQSSQEIIREHDGSFLFFRSLRDEANAVRRSIILAENLIEAAARGGRGLGDPSPWKEVRKPSG